MRIGMLASAALLVGAAAAPGVADLRDVAAASSGETGHIWLMFDESPATVQARMSETGLQLDIAGVEVRQRIIAPYDVSMVSTISVTPTETGARIDIADEIGWNSARAEIVDGAVLVTIGLPRTEVRVDGQPRPETVGTPPSGGQGQPAAQAEQMPRDEPAERGAEAVSRAAPGEDFAPQSQPSASGGEAAGEDARPAGEAPGAAERGAAPSAPASSSATSPAGGDCAAAAAAVEANPWDDDSLHAHAACLAESGDLDAAAAIYEQMLAFAPEDFRALIALAELRDAQGDDAAALDLYNRAAAHAMSDAEASRARARLRELRDN